MAATTTAAPAVAKRRINWSSPLIYAVAYLVVVVSVVPVLYVWLNGFRSNADINANPAGWPNPWYFQNYLTVLGSDRFWGSLASSIIVAVGTTLGVAVLGIMAAFVIAKYDFRGRQGLYAVFAAGLMFPLTVASLPLNLLIRNLGLHGSFLGVIIPQIAFALPTTIIILVPFLRAIPDELEEAAAID
ncbi:MAG: carbohydrate ABC transporter permease, partial [Propionicimonas sp.]